MKDQLVEEIIEGLDGLCRKYFDHGVDLVQMINEEGNVVVTRKGLELWKEREELTKKVQELADAK